MLHEDLHVSNHTYACSLSIDSVCYLQAQHVIVSTQIESLIFFNSCRLRSVMLVQVASLILFVSSKLMKLRFQIFLPVFLEMDIDVMEVSTLLLTFAYSVRLCCWHHAMPRSPTLWCLFFHWPYTLIMSCRVNYCHPFLFLTPPVSSSERALYFHFMSNKISNHGN